jgi:hypothetical protein
MSRGTGRRRHRHLDGTEHAGTPGAPGGAPRLPRTAPRPWIDARILLVAALIASPAAYRSSQGLLSAGAALDRFLVISVGCVVMSVVVRAVWPLLLGESTPTATRTVAGVAMPAAAAEALDPLLVDDAYAGLDGLDGLDGLAGLDALDALDAPAPPSLGSGLDLIEEGVDPSDLLQLGPPPA